MIFSLFFPPQIIMDGSEAKTRAALFPPKTPNVSDFDTGSTAATSGNDTGYGTSPENTLMREYGLIFL